MKKCFLSLILMIVILSACQKDVAKNVIKKQDSTVSTSPDTSKVTIIIPDTLLTRYNSSFNAWLDFKQKNNNSYTFVMKFVYAEPSYNVVITTKVQNGVVVGRDFLVFIYVPDPPNTLAKMDTTAQWHEEGSTLNTHPEGGPLMTMDYIYTNAKNVWLNVDPTKNYLYFYTKNQGLISTCGNFPMGCADNCFVGIQDITSITPL